MIRHRPLREVLGDLKFALDVMEENSHLGFDDGTASVLRDRLLGQITQIEAEIVRETTAPPPSAGSLELSE